MSQRQFEQPSIQKSGPRFPHSFKHHQCCLAFSVSLKLMWQRVGVTSHIPVDCSPSKFHTFVLKRIVIKREWKPINVGSSASNKQWMRQLNWEHQQHQPQGEVEGVRPAHSYCYSAQRKIWAASWTLEISQSCWTYTSHLLWVLLYSHSVSTMHHFWTHQPQDNMTKSLNAPVPLSLLFPVIIHLFTHVLFILMHVNCKACWLFSRLSVTLCLQSSNVVTNHDELDIVVVSWCANLLWRCWETSFLACWGSTWFPTLIHLLATCSPHPVATLTAEYS